MSLLTGQLCVKLHDTLACYFLNNVLSKFLIIVNMSKSVIINFFIRGPTHVVLSLTNIYFQVVTITLKRFWILRHN